MAPQNKKLRVDRARQPGKVAYLGKENSDLKPPLPCDHTRSREGLGELTLNGSPGYGVTREKHLCCLADRTRKIKG